MTKTETNTEVEKALEEIRPFLLNDGGDIALVSIKGSIVRIKFLGACTHCNINKMTLKSGVEETIKRFAPQITEVIAID